MSSMAAHVSPAPASKRTACPFQDNTIAPATTAKRAKYQTPTHIFPKHKLCYTRRGQTLKIEEERAGRSGWLVQAEHKKERPDYSAKEHNGGEPWQIHAAQPHFRRRNTETVTPDVHGRQPDSRSKIEQTARSCGGAVPSRSFESRADTPNNTAEASAIGSPGQR
jgi:hypothetical protein